MSASATEEPTGTRPDRLKVTKVARVGNVAAPIPSDTSTAPEVHFEETDTGETKLHYGLGNFAWPLRIIWFGFICLAIWYVAAFYVPSLRAWMSWHPY